MHTQCIELNKHWGYVENESNGRWMWLNYAVYCICVLYIYLLSSPFYTTLNRCYATLFMNHPFSFATIWKNFRSLPFLLISQVSFVFYKYRTEFLTYNALIIVFFGQIKLPHNHRTINAASVDGLKTDSKLMLSDIFAVNQCVCVYWRALLVVDEGLPDANPCNQIAMRKLLKKTIEILFKAKKYEKNIFYQ